jgi:hypothetical protein
LAARCRELEAKGIEVNCSSAIWCYRQIADAPMGSPWAHIIWTLYVLLADEKGKPVGCIRHLEGGGAQRIVRLGGVIQDDRVTTPHGVLDLYDEAKQFAFTSRTFVNMTFNEVVDWFTRAGLTVEDLS